MPPFPQCGQFCSAKDMEPPTTQSSDISILTSRFFAQTNVHDIPSEKLNVLSADERSEGYYDLHGVSLPAVQETPELVAEKLEELDREMLTVEDRRAFEMATEIDPDYVRSLRLRFLRAENYDVQRAATRFALNFAFRLDMFGEHVLGRDILLTDLTKTDRSLLDTGFMQVTKGKDRAGRSFSCQVMRRLGKEPPPDSAARLFFFCMQYMGNQEYCQRKGVLCCEYMVGIRIEQLLSTNRRARTPLFLRVMASMPVRLNALHVCFDDPRIRTLFKLLTSVIEGKLLCRLQSHFGTDMECMYSMMSFGIPPGTLPIRGNGSLDTRDHEEWLRNAEALCEQQGNHASRGLDIVEEDDYSQHLLYDNFELFDDLTEEFDAAANDDPSPEDVLMGRGKHGKTWPGNLKLKKAVELRWDAYRASNREGKIRISQSIYENFVSSGSRFLVPNKDPAVGGWHDMPRKEVCVRIAHLFRNLRAAEQRVGGVFD